MSLRTPSARSVAVLCVVVAGLLTACGTGPGASPRPTSACVIHDSREPTPMSIRVAWDEDGAWLVENDAAADPLTRSAGPFTAAPSRFLAAASSPGPVWADCAGTLHPGWAERWSSTDGGSTWQFQAASPGGASTLGRAWTAGPAERSEVWTGAGGVQLMPGAAGLITVNLGSPWPDGLAFADPRLGREGDPPGPFPAANPTREVVVQFGTTPPLRAAPPGSAGSARPGNGWRGPRDAVDGGADVLVTRDPAVVRYGRATGRYSAVPLEWDRVYALLRPGGGAGFTDPASAELSGFLTSGVRGEVRSADVPDWWTSPCGAPPAGTDSSRGSDAMERSDSVVVYLAGDLVAEELAARLVALSARAGTPLAAAGRVELAVLPRRSRGVSAAELRRTVAAGDIPVIVSLPTRPLTPCEVKRTWASVVPRPTAGVPLVESRATVLIRSDLGASVIRTWDGLIRLSANAPA